MNVSILIYVMSIPNKKQKIPDHDNVMVMTKSYLKGQQTTGSRKDIKARTLTRT